MIDKKIAITGHTRGFGKYMYDRLIKDNFVMGFSKSAGTDITVKHDRKNMIQFILDFDIFINCAQSGFSQTDLLYEMYEEWKDQRKLIINIGSNARDYINKNKPYKYSVEKNALNNASKQLGRLSLCKVCTVDYGYLVRPKTELNKSSISYSEAYEYVNLALESYNKSHRLLEVLVAHE